MVRYFEFYIRMTSKLDRGYKLRAGRHPAIKLLMKAQHAKQVIEKSRDTMSNHRVLGHIAIYQLCPSHIYHWSCTDRPNI